MHKFQLYISCKCLTVLLLSSTSYSDSTDCVCVLHWQRPWQFVQGHINMCDSTDVFTSLFCLLLLDPRTSPLSLSPLPEFNNSPLNCQSPSGAAVKTSCRVIGHVGGKGGGRGGCSTGSQVQSKLMMESGFEFRKNMTLCLCVCAEV